MTDLISPIVDRLEDALSGLVGVATLRWGTVTSSTPLRVRLDADDEPLLFSPVCPFVGLQVGERVHCAIQNRRVTIMNIAGRGPATQSQVNAGVEPVDYVTPATLKNGLANGTILPPGLKGQNLGSANLNDMRTTGWYTGYEWVNSPVGASAFIAVAEVIVYSDDWILQRWTEINTDITTYQRVYHSGTTWTAWKVL